MTAPVILTADYFGDISVDARLDSLYVDGVKIEGANAIISNAGEILAYRLPDGRTVEPHAVSYVPRQPPAPKMSGKGGTRVAVTPTGAIAE